MWCTRITSFSKLTEPRLPPASPPFPMNPMRRHHPLHLDVCNGLGAFEGFQKAAFVSSYASKPNIASSRASKLFTTSLSRDRPLTRRKVVPAPANLRACSESHDLSSSEAIQTVEDFRAPLWRGPIITLIYIAFVLHGLAFSPGSLNDPGVVGLIMSGKLSEVNDLFLALFCGLGQVGGVYGALLMPAASKNMKLNTFAFTVLGVLFGFGALGPYLGWRKYVPHVTREDVQSSWLGRYFESRFHSILLLGFAAFLYILGFGLLAPSSVRDTVLYSCWQNTVHLFQTDRFVHITLVDAAVLCTLLWGPLCEDMRRRGWIFDWKHVESYINAACILAAPGFGPALYLLLRSPLPSSTVEKSDALH